MTLGATDTIEQLTINTIRTLSMDAVQAANSGHPGTPMALAPVTYKLWRDFLRFDPELPVWANRDRFVLSVGHASALLYSMLHLAGVKSVNPDYEIVGEPAVSLEDLRRFRQLDSKCPGHPEYRWTRASNARPVRWAPGSPPASGWPLPDSGRPLPSTGPATNCSITTSTRCAATAA